MCFFFSFYIPLSHFFFFFFFNDTATTEIYTLSLHDALPISSRSSCSGRAYCSRRRSCSSTPDSCLCAPDRKSTRLNSSHLVISYAVFCLKKKKNNVEINSCIIYTTLRTAMKNAITDGTVSRV